MTALLANMPRLTAPLRYAEHWVARGGGLLVSFLAGAVAVAAAFAFKLHWSLELAAFPGVFVLFLALWWVARELYWHSGRGRKVGVVYDGHGVPIDDWVRTRKEFTRLVEEGKLDRHISLRLLPAPMIATHQRQLKISRKYGFSTVLTVTCSQQAGPATPSSLGGFQTELRVTFARGVKEQFVRQIVEIHGALLRPPKRDDVLGVLKHRAETIFEPLLLWLGVTDLCKEDYAGASRFFHILDNQLQNRFSTDQQPRATIRRLDSLALDAPSRFSPSAIPEPGALETATAAAHKCAKRYGDQFPQVRLVLARDYFFSNKLDDALAETEKALCFNLDADAKAGALLNLAVLCLLLDRPERSADSFDELREKQHLALLDWKDLTKFADCAAEFDYENAVFLQALYRRLAGSTDNSKPYEDRAFKWLQQDASRNRLRNVLEQAKPVAPMRADAAPATGKEKRKKTKKSGARTQKRKARSKRRGR